MSTLDIDQYPFESSDWFSIHETFLSMQDGRHLINNSGSILGVRGPERRSTISQQQDMALKLVVVHGLLLQRTEQF